MTQPWTDLLTAAVEDFARLTGEIDPTLPVPGCPDWAVADLVEHLGAVHVWARHAVVEQNPEAPPAQDAPHDLSLLPDWYRTQAAELLDALRSRPDDAPAWTFGRGVGTAAWWQRRQTHETLLHTRDLLKAGGRADEWRVDPAIAWDAVDEVAHMFYPRQVRLARCEMLTTALRLEATDLPGSAPVVVGDVEDTVTVSGPASDLLLLLWHRTTSADPAAAAVLAQAITP
ncbi:maleylpyruvate isomerase family mycothiol-dependent enzyme [Nocardioides sp. GY 10127]|uniref:maleylpyruvate isomerase family mycothiol-dependent enzyme n=1 Tax=Nocardioides sp. GY 10127 TaxID=2569762 RepID=UPI0010A78A59|nr:maleylpyruvate isomerase family mycothiol-dependent enzyme [Nocardioides sp. GY 10127]TIC81867.1 maleylpyruvate isomerase family mycothiol-dependent enzyme [Nocardioides sp. GY 10127]